MWAVRRRCSPALDDAVPGSGPVEILVNNAGQAGSAPFGRLTSPLAANDRREPRRDFLCMQARDARMIDAGWGRIVNIASTAGLVGYRYISAYCAAKHGVVGLTRAAGARVATRALPSMQSARDTLIPISSRMPWRPSSPRRAGAAAQAAAELACAESPAAIRARR